MIWIVMGTFYIPRFNLNELKVRNFNIFLAYLKYYRQINTLPNRKFLEYNIYSVIAQKLRCSFCCFLTIKNVDLEQKNLNSRVIVYK